MAIVQREQRLEDSTDKIIISLTGVFDGSQLANNTIIDVSTLANALNANGFIMTSNTNPKSLYRISIRKIFYSLTDGSLQLNWQNSNGNTPLWFITAGQGQIPFSSGDGEITVITNPDTANSSGDIQVTSQGTNANSRYSLTIVAKKDARDYDQGQTRDPAAFNAGSFRLQ